MNSYNFCTTFRSLVHIYEQENEQDITVSEADTLEIHAKNRFLPKQAFRGSRSRSYREKKKNFDSYPRRHSMGVVSQTVVCTRLMCFYYINSYYTLSSLLLK